MMISRTRVEAEARESLAEPPVTTLLGPRQCGKTTLARQIGSQAQAAFFDMQDTEVVSAFQNPKFVLMPLEGLVILDEALLVPALYPVLRRLQPWFENIGKRQRKSPKLYIRDSGLLHVLLGIREESALRLHPSAGASWEGFVLEQILAHLRPDETYFWQTQAGAELDLLALADGKRLGFEMKLTESPRITKSMRIAMNDLRLDHLFVIHSGGLRFAIDDCITALPAMEIPLLADPAFILRILANPAP